MRLMIPRTSIRTGCLTWFVGFGIIGNLFLIPANILSFINGVDALAPIWFKAANVGLLVADTVCMIALWRGQKWGLPWYLIITTLYWVAHTLYRGFTMISLLILLAMTALFLGLVYRERRTPTPPG